ncbi:MAG TPA: BatD family protein [Gemmatimonadales bacterium]|nr:BatD family protein [Gemmatimonadales bacterium]
MTLALWMLVVLQAVPPPDVTARVDRTHLAAGEDLTLTIRARTRSPEPIGVVLPGLTGFTIVGSREVSEVTIGGVGGPVRTTTRELQLRAGRPGTLVIGPVRVHQGNREVTTSPVTVTVDSADAVLATVFSPSARRLVQAAREPARNDRVALSVILPGDSVLVGQQLDVIAAAWFPRELRARLRQAPVLTLQTPEGVWSYPGAAPSEVALSRLVRGQWMDVFVAHQAVFPLAPGRIVIPPALVEYAVPATFSFFSREDRYSLRSDTVTVTVLALPARGGRPDDQPVAAQGLGLNLDMDPASGRVGEPIAMTASVSGVGNVALWPEPVMRWPPAFRAYSGETGMRLEPRDGRIAGTKIFHYLVMPDSAGSFVLPEVRYPYYDLVAGDYRVASIAPRTLAVAPGIEPRAARALPPLATGDAPTWTDSLANGLVPWGWLALLVGPPVLAWLWRRREEREPAAAQVPRPVRLTRLGQLEREFHAVLASQVPDARARDGDGLARALRATGLDSAVAGHVMRLRDRLRASRYGPRGQGDAAALAAELEQVLQVLDAEPGRTRRLGSVAMLVTLMALAMGEGGERRVAAQGPSAEALYRAGALRAAADSFAGRAAAHPDVAAHWYNLGATLYRAGADGKATAAWTRAVRLAPRDPLIGRTRDLLASPDAPSEALLTPGWATPGEWALVAALLWTVAWLAVATRRRRTIVLGLALLTAAATALAAREGMRRARPLAIVLNPATPVRAAPYGNASAASTVEAGAALLIERRWGPWLEVRRADGIRGWVLVTEVARL